jgi:methionyl-tRNA formyltransferase
MRFAIATIDRYLGVFEAFVQAGGKPLKLFTVPMKHIMGNNQAAIAYAEKMGAAVQLSRFTERDMLDLRDQGCEALVVASYDWKIPEWQGALTYAINFHSSPLPEGRGSYPPVRAILEKRDRWAITCHKLADGIDTGDILAAEEFPLGSDECHERIDLKIQMAAKKLAARVAGDLPALWGSAKPQSEGSYWPRYRLDERIIPFAKPVEAVLRHIRAFGGTESLAKINGTWLIVTRAVGWAEAHTHAPGTVVHVFNHTIVVASAGGYIGILDSALAPAPVVEELQFLGAAS